MTDFNAKAFAAELIAAHKFGASLVATPRTPPPSIDVAYAVQDIVRAHLGPAAAWKVGAPNPTAEPTCAPILAGGLNTVDARRGHAGREIGIELEIAFRLGRDFPASSIAPTPDVVRSAIEGAYLAIETCVPRLADGLKAPPLVVLADRGINHGLVLGGRVDPWAAIDPKTLGAQVEIDGHVVAATKGGHSHGDIFGLLVWQVGHCVTRRGGLSAGTVITTGSWMGIVWTVTPAHVRGTFDGLGSIALDLVSDASPL